MTTCFMCGSYTTNKDGTPDGGCTKCGGNMVTLNEKEQNLANFVYMMLAEKPEHKIDICNQLAWAMFRLEYALSIIENEYPEGHDNYKFAEKTRKEFAEFTE